MSLYIGCFDIDHRYMSPDRSTQPVSYYGHSFTVILEKGTSKDRSGKFVNTINVFIADMLNPSVLSRAQYNDLVKILEEKLLETFL